MAAITTVLGTIAADKLGVTMAHEHILLDITPYFTPPGSTDGQWLAHSPLTLENIGWIRQHWMSSYPNLRLDEEQVAIAELVRYSSAGGNALIDATVIGIGRDPDGLKRIAQATGLHIVMGTGYYVDLLHPPYVATASEQDLSKVMERELTVGVGDTSIRAGFIGEVGTSYPITDNEVKVLRASARVANTTGCALLVHPGRHPSVPRQIIDLVTAVGLPADRLVLAHTERTIQDPDALAEIAAQGCMLSFDVFGMETSMIPAVRATNPDGSHTVAHPSGHDMPSDAQRISLIEALIAAGHLDRLLVSQDVGTKHRLATYGGHGYDHFLNVVRPWMLRRGLTNDDVDRMLIDNPARTFTIG